MSDHRRRRAGALVGALVGVLVAAGCADDGPPAVASDVAVTAAGCSPVDRTSSGVVVADGYVLTTAHGVRGATTVSADGTPAVVVAVDSRIDAALLAVATSGPPIETAVDAVPGNARLDGRPVVVERLVVVSIDEPLDGATYRRRALIIDGEVSHGDSGAGVLGPDGRLLGMVFATSTGHESLAYAVAVSELRPFLARHTGSDSAVDLGSCP